METHGVVIVGGGITGLSAAYYVQRQFANSGRSVRVTLIEKSEKLGGKIQTLQRDGFVIEKGPDSVLARKQAFIDLTRDLGLENELVPMNPQANKTFILHNGRLHPMPPGLMMGVPIKWRPFLQTGLISARGKARAALDLIIPRRKDPADEAVGAFLNRRLGREVTEHLADPLLSGIYAANLDELSLQATFPQFAHIERKYRSLIYGMRENSRQVHKTASALPAGAAGSTFLSYRGGLKTMVQALEGKLQDVDRINGQTVSRIARGASGIELHLDSGRVLAADAAVLAVPAFAAAELLADLPAAVLLREIQYVSVANVVLAFHEEDIPRQLGGTGFLVPRKEKRQITACTWTSSKWMHTAPEGKALLRCYVGRSGDESWTELTDEELIRSVRSELQHLMGIEQQPLFYEVTRWHRAMPQYRVGHLTRMERVKEELAARMPGVFLAGSAYYGVGIPDCIRQGKEAAEQVFRHVADRIAARG